jgi:hypothetical protein
MQLRICVQNSMYHHQVKQQYIIVLLLNRKIHSSSFCGGLCAIFPPCNCNQNPHTHRGFLTLLTSISWKTHCLVWWPITATCVRKHEKPTETVLNVLVFTHMMLCQSVNSWRHSEETGCLHLHGIYHLSWTTMMMGAANSSNTSVTIYLSPQFHGPEDLSFH